MSSRPRPLAEYEHPDLPTLEQYTAERRTFLKQVGSGGLLVTAGSWGTFCTPLPDDDDHADDDDDDDDDNDQPWDDDDGGIDDDDADPLEYADFPQKGEHGVTLTDGDTAYYSMRLFVTDWSVIDYLRDNEEQVFEIADARMEILTCLDIEDSLFDVENLVSIDLSALVHDVGGLTCSVAAVEIRVEHCGAVPG